MDFDLQWVLIGLPVAFALGWLASRFDLRQNRRDSRDAPKAYFKGLNLLLNEQHDKAIDAFIEAVQSDPDTTELHFALGNLFRRRGEFERAVRVHQHLLGRGDLKSAERDRARHALAQDFMKAGLFDRAEAAFRELQGTAFDHEAQLALLTLFERSRDWPAAIEVARALQGRGEPGSYSQRLAHYGCELALEADARGDAAAAAQALEEALRSAPLAPRPRLLQGQRLAQAGQGAAALDAWAELARSHPALFNLVAPDFARTALECGQAERARVLLSGLYEQHPGMDLLEALRSLDASAGTARLVEHLRRQPTLRAAQELLAAPLPAWTEAGVAGVREAVERAAQPLQRYRCAACGFETRSYFWQCPGCLSWDSYPPLRIEEI